MAAKNEHHQAKLNGNIYYYTGKPCKNGHIANRYTSSKGCTVCHSEKNYTQIRTEKAKEYATRYRKENKEKIHEFRKNWLEKNLGKGREQVARRRAAKMQRTPSWLNDGHLFEIECIHKYASYLRLSGLQYEVDHIVPLQGKSVSGLHVPWNMQVIHISENRSKGNKHYV